MQSFLEAAMSFLHHISFTDNKAAGIGTTHAFYKQLNNAHKYSLVKIR